MKKAIFTILTIALFLPNVFASEEGVLALSSFTIESRGIGESGPVLIRGEKNQNNEFASLTIEAFNRKYTMTEEDLKKIPPMPYNAIQLSFEHGYKETGGKTIYLIFHVGFSGGGITNKVLITFTEEGAVKIE